MSNLWQRRFILVGDSIQAYVVDDTVTNPALASNLTAVRLSSVYNAATIQNISSPGATLAGPTGLSNYPDDVIHQIGAFGINGVIITLGANDLRNPVITTQDYLQAYANYLVALRNQGYTGPVVMLSPLKMYDQTIFPLGKTPEAFRDAVMNLAAFFGGPAQNLFFIDGLTCPLTASAFADGLHLNNAGHVQFGDWLYNKVKALNLWP